MSYEIFELSDGTFGAIDSAKPLPVAFETKEAAKHGAYLSHDVLVRLAGSSPLGILTYKDIVAASGGYGGGN